MKLLTILLMSWCYYSITLSGFASITYNKVQARWDEWREGIFEGVGFERPGKGLMPSQACTLYAEFSDMMITSGLQDGNSLWIATSGDHAILWRVKEGNLPEKVFESSEIWIKGLMRGPKGEIYFAVSPGSKIYVIRDGQAPQIFAELPSQLVWDLAVDGEGLVVATGQPAALFRLPFNYQVSQTVNPFFTSPDASHFTALAKGNDRLWYVGAGNVGIVYEVAESGSFRALANTNGEEVTAVVKAHDGAIYYTTFREVVESPNPLEVITAAIQSSANPVDAAKAPDQGHDQEKGNNLHGSLAKQAYGALYRIDPSGVVEGIWGVREAGIFSLKQLSSGQFYVGTSSRSKVFCIKDNQNWSLITQLPTGGAITALLINDDHSGYVCSSNPARVYRLSSGKAQMPTFTSTVFDAEQSAIYGKIYGISDNGISLKGVKLESRTGNVPNPDFSWSPWIGSQWGEKIGAPQGRYLQYRLIWEKDSQDCLNSLRFFYTYPNRPPSVRDARVSFLGVQVQVQDMIANRPLELKNFLQEGGLDTPTDPAAVRHLEMRATGESGFMTCAWDADDPNGDWLSFNVELQALGSDQWMLFAKELSEPIYSFSVRGLKEGFYRLKVTASDHLSNGCDNALSGFFITPPFMIDSTPPQVKIISQLKSQNEIVIKLKAVDSLTPLSLLSYVLDGGIPYTAVPDDGLFDGLEEDFTLKFDYCGEKSHTLLVEIEDEWGNQATTAVYF